MKEPQQCLNPHVQGDICLFEHTHPHTHAPTLTVRQQSDVLLVWCFALTLSLLFMCQACHQLRTTRPKITLCLHYSLSELPSVPFGVKELFSFNSHKLCSCFVSCSAHFLFLLSTLFFTTQTHYQHCKSHLLSQAVELNHILLFLFQAATDKTHNRHLDVCMPGLIYIFWTYISVVCAFFHVHASGAVDSPLTCPIRWALIICLSENNKEGFVDFIAQ